MADFAAKAPFEADKPNFLHDRSELPAAPTRSRSDLLRWSLIIVLGVLFTVAFVALEYQTRASWSGRRDFVVPTTIPLSAMAGVSFAALLVRREMSALGMPLVLLGIVIILTAVNATRGTNVDGRDIFRDLLTWTTAFFMLVTLIWVVVTLIWVEVTKPIRAPLAEM